MIINMNEGFESSFIALVFRMKNIIRWSLMYNCKSENLSQHTTECSFIESFLAIVGNEYFNKKYNVEKLTVCSLFHDITEVFTGDIPTLVKYCSNGTLSVFKDLEERATNKLLDYLPSEIKNIYSDYITQKILTSDEIKLLKVADKLCAYIKCITEVEMGNKEFNPISLSILNDIKTIGSEEAEYFLEHCIKSFSLSSNALKGSLPF